MQTQSEIFLTAKQPPLFWFTKPAISLLVGYHLQPSWIFTKSGYYLSPSLSANNSAAVFPRSSALVSVSVSNVTPPYVCCVRTAVPCSLSHSLPGKALYFFNSVWCNITAGYQVAGTLFLFPIPLLFKEISSEQISYLAPGCPQGDRRLRGIQAITFLPNAQQNSFFHKQP